MEWSDDAIVLSARKHGEGAIILNLLTLERGHWSGLVRGGASKRNRGLFEPGNFVRATWTARLEDHLGNFRCEAETATAAAVMHDPLRLSALSAACAMADACLPEREAHRPAYEGLAVLLGCLGDDDPAWPTIYAKWELGLLQELGFGLDINQCAVTGAAENLAYVSPRSGRAVTEEGAGVYKDRLFPLPEFLISSGYTGDYHEIAQALDITGHFLARDVFVHNRHQTPKARDRFTALLHQRLAP